MVHARSWRQYSANGYHSKGVCSTALSEVDSVHGGGSFPFLYGRRAFLITLRGAGVALRVNKRGFTGEGDRLT